MHIIILQHLPKLCSSVDLGYYGISLEDKIDCFTELSWEDAALNANDDPVALRREDHTELIKFINTIEKSTFTFSQFDGEDKSPLFFAGTAAKRLNR